MPVRWWTKVEHLKRLQELSFTPRLNIIWGPNGSGKSTLLTAIANVTHSKAGGRSVVTHQSLLELRSNKRVKWNEPDALNGLAVYGDGKSVLYYSPMDSIGLIGGMAGFDDDFFSEGMVSIGHTHISSGQSAQAKLHQVVKHQDEPVKWKHKLIGDSDVCRFAYAFAQETFSKRCAAGPQTLLMDEPDAHLDWPNKLKFWDTMRQTQKFQLIIATHSPFALRLPNVNYIELEEGYGDKCREALLLSGLWHPNYPGFPK
jgi:predicted ATPase